MRARAITILAVGVLALPASADAKLKYFGSNLKPDVNHAIARPTDTAFWAKSFPNKALHARAPDDGRIEIVVVKGTAIKHGDTKPNTLFHFQTLRPAGNGRVLVKFTSQDFHMPAGGNPNRLTAFHPTNLCVLKGDWISFADVGGYQSGSYPKGTPFKIFSNHEGAATNIFRNNNGIDNGSIIKGNPKQDLELMMRMGIATGDAAGVCHH